MDNLNVQDNRDFWFSIVDLCVWEDERLSLSEKGVYTALCTFASVQGRSCFPSIAAIAKRAGCSERTVQRALTRLCEVGYITVRKRFKDAAQIESLYTIIGHKADRAAIPEADVCHDDNMGCHSDGGRVSQWRTELEPENHKSKDTPTVADEKASPAVSEEESTAEEEPKTLEEPELIEHVPSAMRSTAEYLLLKTGRKGLVPCEVGALMALEKKHYPARVQKEITTAVSRFESRGRPLSSLTFEYIYESLKNQRPTKTARKKEAVPKAVPVKDDYADWEEENRRRLMQKYGGADD